MTIRRLRAALLGGVTAFAVTTPAPPITSPAYAQWTVFDPWNYGQNLLSAARALDQINNQIASLQNEAQMLINQARNLASLPYSSLVRLQQAFNRTQMLLARAQRLAYEVTDIERAFTQAYGSSASLGTSQQIIENARERWRTSVAGFQDALATQATVIGNLTGTRAGMVEWLVARVRWLYLVGGNHDVWSGATDPIRWFATQAAASYEWHGMRLALTSPNGREVRINARHDFAGTSQWNGAHAPAKAARLGFVKDHIYTCGHRHAAAHNTLVWENGEHVAHAIRVGTYKVFDDYSDAKGFPKENLPAAVTVVDPEAREATGLVTVFWDVEAAADFLRYLRRRQ